MRNCPGRRYRPGLSAMLEQMIVPCGGVSGCISYPGLALTYMVLVLEDRFVDLRWNFMSVRLKVESR